MDVDPPWFSHFFVHFFPSYSYVFSLNKSLVATNFTNLVIITRCTDAFIFTF
jgi:hypothetical protein